MLVVMIRVRSAVRKRSDQTSLWLFDSPFARLDADSSALHRRTRFSSRSGKCSDRRLWSGACLRTRRDEVRYLSGQEPQEGRQQLTRAASLFHQRLIFAAERTHLQNRSSSRRKLATCNVNSGQSSWWNVVQLLSVTCLLRCDKSQG